MSLLNLKKRIEDRIEEREAHLDENEYICALNDVLLMIAEEEKAIWKNIDKNLLLEDT